MHSPLKLTLVAATACLVGMASTAQSMAQSGPVARPDPYALYQQRTASIYQGPGGTYDSLSDYTRDVNGIPCGIECTRRADQRWSR
jgi:hypothetical protein